MIIKRTNPQKSWTGQQREIALKILQNKILKSKGKGFSGELDIQNNLSQLPKRSVEDEKNHT